MPRIGTIEYRIEQLTVERIQNGILDLGVHMGNELDKRIQVNGGGEKEPEKQPLEERVQQIEQSMLEVKDKLQVWEERWQEMEKRSRSFDQRIRSLEVLHP